MPLINEVGHSLVASKMSSDMRKTGLPVGTYQVPIQVLNSIMVTVTNTTTENKLKNYCTNSRVFFIAPSTASSEMTTVPPS